MIFVNALFAALTIASPPDSLLSADSLVSALRKGGYTMIWRHGATDRSVQEPMGYQNVPRFQQRNLTDRGIADSKIVGAIFKAAGIPVGEVLSSPMFRTRETAEYAFGRVVETPILRQLDPTPEQRQLISAAPAPGTNRVLVTHHFVIERNVPGIKPGQVGEGEAVVVRHTRGDSVQLVGIFKMADWERFGAMVSSASAAGGAVGHGAPGAARPATPVKIGPLVIPALLQTPERAAIGEYLKAFNSGDAARMRAFYEKSVVPNPERTMEQRMEVFARLKTQLGNVAIDSTEVIDGKVAVKVQTTNGGQATITFTVEPQAPFRLSAISFQMMQAGPPPG